MRPVTEVALRGTDRGDSGRGVSMFTEFASGNLQLRRRLPAGRHRPRPSPTARREQGLSFKYKGESQAEFEQRERRCLATAIYFEARGEPRPGPDRRRPGDHEPGAQPAIPGDDLRRRLSGPDGARLPVLLHL